MIGRGVSAVILAMLAGPGWSDPATLSPDCESVRQDVAQSLVWKSAGRGLDLAQMAPGAHKLIDLTLVRLDLGTYQLRAFDMRDIPSLNQQHGYYAAPFYALRELQRALPQAAVLSSGGMTRSYSEPVPAGFLKIEGSTRNRVAPKDVRLNGVLCIDQGGRPSVLSDDVEGQRKAPADVDMCFAGFQTGPVLVDNGAPAAIDNDGKLRVRIAVAVAGNTAWVAFSSGATSAALGCALTAKGLSAQQAIALQSHSLGGAVLGPQLRELGATMPLGNIDVAVASALVVEPRPLRRSSVNAPSRRVR